MFVFECIMVVLNVLGWVSILVGSGVDVGVWGWGWGWGLFWGLDE